MKRDNRREGKKTLEKMVSFESSQTTQELSFSSMDASSDSEDSDLLNLGGPDAMMNLSKCILVCDISMDDECGVEQQPRRKKNRNVSFSEVEVRRYSLVVGDNPAVKLGVPISIGWDYVSAEIMSIDEFEKIHSVGKGEEELSIPSDEREIMVRNAGFSTQQIRDSVRAVNAVKMEREQTLDTLNNASQEEFMEKLRKSVWNATLRRRVKKRERALLKDCLLKDARKHFLPIPAAC